jgi:hypothetical protein
MNQNISILERIKSPSPLLFKKLGKVGLTIGAIGGAIVSIPTLGIVLPAALVTLGGYFMAVGLVTKAVSTLTVDFDAKAALENK